MIKWSEMGLLEKKKGLPMAEMMLQVAEWTSLLCTLLGALFIDGRRHGRWTRASNSHRMSPFTLSLSFGGSNEDQINKNEGEIGWKIFGLDGGRLGKKFWFEIK